METRIRLDLHADAFAMCIGGSWTLYDPSGRRRACEVYVAFSKPMPADTAAAYLAHVAVERGRSQLRLF